MRKLNILYVTAVAASSLAATGVLAQETPKQPGVTLPPVQVIQKKAEAKPKPKAVARQAKKPPAAATVVPGAPVAAETTDAGQVSLSPIKGSEIAIEKVPNSVTKVSSGDIAAGRIVTAQEALQQRVPGIILSDMQGNDFQTSVQYRGFESSPLNGTPQGLAVYQNGVRVNEVFGDIVNWDFMPGNAIDSMTVMSGNPMFGLNALGGAISVKMKDGFGFHGVESDTRFGSFGRRQEAVQVGQQVGNFAAYAAWEGIKDDGWRDHSASEVSRFYGDVGIKGKRDSEVHLNYSQAANFVGVAGLSPKVLLDEGWNKTFSTPQTTVNRMQMVSLNGTVGVTETLKLSGTAYYRKFRQKHVDGNITDAEACEDDEGGAGFLCLGGDPLRNAAGEHATNPALADGHVVGEIDRTTARADSYGGSLQATNNARLFGHGNLFIAGASIDHGNARNTSSAELGDLDTANFVVTGNGFFPVSPLAISPLKLNTTTDYFGLFVSDTFDVTDRLAVTAGARYNYATIKLNDLNGASKVAEFGDPEANLTGEHTFTRINPVVGATYKLAPRLTLYGGYSEANRAPTPAELACSNPKLPCLMENFLASDPPLKQVVSHTWELGLRGSSGDVRSSGKLDWSAGLFRTLNTDDIINELADASAIRGTFRNAGETLRQGVEASASYTTRRMQLYGTYAFIDATFQSNLSLNSPSNPGNTAEDEVYRIAVRPGDHMPGIPAHRIKAGASYMLTDAWKIGANVVYSSSQYYVGDENNQNAKLPGYAVVNLQTSYDISKRVQIYGMVNNVFDNKYAYYGTYFETGSVGERFGDHADARSVTPAAPLAAYGGVKVKF